MVSSLPLDGRFLRSLRPHLLLADVHHVILRVLGAPLSASPSVLPCGGHVLQSPWPHFLLTIPTTSPSEYSVVRSAPRSTGLAVHDTTRWVERTGSAASSRSATYGKRATLTYTCKSYRCVPAINSTVASVTALANAIGLVTALHVLCVCTAPALRCNFVAPCSEMAAHPPGRGKQVFVHVPPVFGGAQARSDTKLRLENLASHHAGREVNLVRFVRHP